MSYKPSIGGVIDSATGAAIGISYPHHEVHAGSSYYASEVQSVDTTTYKWGLTTPNTTKWTHLAFELDGTGELLFLLIENPGTYSGGGAWSAVNADRNSVNVSGMTLLSGVTATGGTTLFTHRSGDTAGGVQAHAPGGLRNRFEFILKQNEQYVLQATTYAAIYASINLSWYEHTNAG